MYIELLQIFAEEAAEQSAQATGESAAAGAAEPAQTGASGGERGTGEAGQAARLSFKELIANDPEYKREYDSAVKSAVHKRMKSMKSEMEAFDPGLEILAKHYGMDGGKLDRKAIMERVTADSSLLEDAAMKEGMTTEAYMRVMEADRVLAEQKARKAEEAENMEFKSLVAEAEALKSSKYPDFNFLAEIENNEPFFKMAAGLKKMGFQNPVEAAYNAMNLDRIVENATRNAVDTAKAQISSSIQSGAQRPGENGVSGMAAETKLNPAKLTHEQLAEIRKRVMRGEEITFN